VVAKRALAVLAVLGACLLPAQRAERHGAASPARSAFEVFTPAAGAGAILAAFGGVWLEDRARSRLLRLDARGRVRRALDVGDRIAFAAGQRDVWVLERGNRWGTGLYGPLLRVDPGSARVRGRTRLPAGAIGFGLVSQGDAVWLWGPRDIFRVRTRTGRLGRRIVVAGEHGELTGVTAWRRLLVAATADGHLLRFDPRTGARVGTARVALRPPAVRGVARGRVLLSAGGVVAAADPVTGRMAWRRRLGYRSGTIAHYAGLLWVHSAALHEPGDRLTALDAETGRVVTSGLVPGFGTTGVAGQAGRLWTATAGGRVFAVAPFAA
jgi:outer membrane protein assembly factor BamB